MKRIWDIVRISDSCDLALAWWGIFIVVSLVAIIWYWYQYNLTFWKISFILFLSFLAALLPLLLSFWVSNYWWQYVCVCLLGLGVGFALPHFRCYLTDIAPEKLSNNLLLIFCGILFALFHATITVISGACGEIYYCLGYVTVVLPEMIRHFQAAVAAIPPEKYRLWRYPQQKRREFIKTASVQDRIVRIALQISTDIHSQPITVPLSAPVSMTLDDVLFIFLYDYNTKYSNNPIQTLTTGTRHFGWLFAIYSSNGKRYLDCNRSFAQNHIQDNDVIVAEREMI